MKVVINKNPGAEKLHEALGISEKRNDVIALVALVVYSVVMFRVIYLQNKELVAQTSRLEEMTQAYSDLSEICVDYIEEAR